MLNPEREVFTNELLRLIEAATTRADAMTKCAERWQFSTRTFDRHWKKAWDRYRKNQAEIQKALLENEKAAALAEQNMQIMSARERKEYLTKLIRGEIVIPTKEIRFDQVQKKFVTIPVDELASHQARISAINELNRMDGSHAPTKVARTKTDGEDVPDPPAEKIPMTTIETILTKYGIKTN